MKRSRLFFLTSLLLIPAGFGCNFFNKSDTSKSDTGGSGHEATNKSGTPTSTIPKAKLVGKWLLEKTESDGEPGKTVWEFVDDGGAPETEKNTLKSVSDTTLVLRNEGSDMTYQRQGSAPAGKTKAEKLVGRWVEKDVASGFPPGYMVFTKEGKVMFGSRLSADGKFVDQLWFEGTFKVDGDTITKLVQVLGNLLINDGNHGTISRPAPIRWQLKGDKLHLGPCEDANHARIVNATAYTIKLEADDDILLVDSAGKRMELKKQKGE